MVDLVAVEEFLNTLDERTFSVHGETHVPSDALTSVDALSAWLTTHGLPAERLSASDLTTAVTLRSALRKVLIEDGEEPASALASFPLRLAPAEGGGLRIASASGQPGLDQIIETVAASVAGGGFRRLKLCASTDCRWAFYDTSRSGGGRWCNMNVCGNRHKTKAYRRRRTS